MLRLEDTIAFVRDTVNYDDDDPSPTDWPSDSPEGPSIYLTDLLADNNVGTNWTRSVVGVDDAVAANGFPFLTLDVGSPGNAPAFALGNLIVSESSSSTDVTEGGATDDFTIVLDATPGDDVIVTVTPDSQVDLGAGAGVAINHTFTPATALTPFSIDIDAVDDQIAEGSHTGLVSFSTASNDNGFNNLVVSDLVANITDNDTAGITIAESGGSTDVAEGGATDDFTIVLDTIPTDTVTVTLTPDAELDLGAGQGVAVTRVFTTGDSLTPQSVTVTAFDDTADEGLHTGLITFSVASTDTLYNGLSIPGLAANITDNDGATLLTITSETENFTGPGTYTLDFFITATGGSQTIAGFNLPLIFDVPGVTFGGTDSDFTPNSGFLLEFVAPLTSANTYGVAASTGPGLTLSDGQTDFLFSVDVTVDNTAVITSPTVVASIVDTGPDAVNILFVDASNMVLPNPSVGTGATLDPGVPASPPTITDVIVAGSSWAPSFVDTIDGGGANAGNGIGLSLPGVEQLRNLAWSNLDTIVIEFNEDVQKANGLDIDTSDISLGGINIADYELDSAYGLTTSYSDGGGTGPYRLTIGLSQTADFVTDKLVLTVADSVQNISGVALDGEWTDGVSIFSGDLTAGGDFVFNIEILVGDVDDSDGVFVNDVVAVNGAQFTFPPGYNPYLDIDGSGGIFVNDVVAVNASQFTFLPSGNPTPPPPQSPSSGRHVEARR